MTDTTPTTNDPTWLEKVRQYLINSKSPITQDTRQAEDAFNVDSSSPTPKGYAAGGIVRPDDNPFAVPGMPYDVSSMTPNLDTTTKNVAPPPSGPVLDSPGILPPAPAALPPIAPPPSATPTGAPQPKDVDPKIGTSHPGMSPDQIEQYLASQHDQLNKYGPDQEKAVMDEIRKRQHSIPGIIGDKMAQASDDIMQGVARAGSGQAMARRQQAKESELASTLQEQQDLQKNNRETVGMNQQFDAMDHNSPIGKAMLATWGPLLDKLGIPKDKQAAMIPSLISSMSPELVKHEDVMAKLQAARMQKEGMMGYRQDQADQNNWTKLGDRVNALTAGSRKALGVAATNNMRADRALVSLDDPKLTKSPQLITQLVQDIAGIYKGGAPDETSMKHGMYPNLMNDVARLQSYLTSQPESAATKQLLGQIREQVTSLKRVDNRAIENNLGINAVEFEPLIKKDPERWQRMMGAVTHTEANPVQPGAQQPAAEFATEQEAEKAGLPAGTIISIGGRKARVR